MRYSRHLKANKGTETPTNLVFVDTEFSEERNDSASDGKVFRLRLWEATRVRFDGGEVSRRITSGGATADGFHQWLSDHSERYRCTWIFAHNASVDVTILGFWKKLDERVYTFDPKYKRDRDGKETSQISWRGKLCGEDRPFFMQIRSGDKHYKIVDTCNYWPVPLSTLGESFALPKGEMPSQLSPDSEWIEYCRRDVDILETAVTWLLRRWRSEDCGVFQVTGPALSLTNFRHTCAIRTKNNDYLDIVPHPNSPQAKFERTSYFGGRIQPFFVGPLKHKIYHVDVNSLYPAMMHKHLFPRKYSHTLTDTSVAEIKDVMCCYGVIARVYIDSMTNAYPVRINGRQYHVCGRYHTTLAGDELRHAIESGSAKSIIMAQCYSMAPLFKEWVDYWYQRKVDSRIRTPPDLAEYEFTKLILTSLSGKFTQRGRFWKDLAERTALERWGGWIDEHPDTGLPCAFRGVAGHTQYMTKDEDAEHVLPAISAFITAAAREFMRGIVNQLPRTGVYYMATDSLIVDERAFRYLSQAKLIDDYKLGAFRLIDWHFNGEIVASNHYRLGGTTTIAGHQGRCGYGPNGELIAELWDRTPTILATGPRDDIIVRPLEIAHIRPDYKGTIDANGYWSPYILQLDNELGGRSQEGGYRLSDDWPTAYSLTPNLLSDR